MVEKSFSLPFYYEKYYRKFNIFLHCEEYCEKEIVLNVKKVFILRSSIQKKLYMKFTKEDAFGKIKSKLTENKRTLQMSERSINEQLETLIALVANEEMEIDDFVNKVLPMFKTVDANVGNDRSKFVKEWEDSHPTEKKPKEGEQKKEETTTDPALAKLLEEVASLKKGLEEARVEKSIATKRSDLLKAMKEKGIKDEQWAKNYLSEITVTEDLDIESKAESALKFYNLTNTAPTDPFTPGASSSSSKDNKNALDDIKEIRKNQM